MNKELINCSICLDAFTNKVTLNCTHNFCKSCIKEWISYNNYNCPICRAYIEYQIIEKYDKCFNYCIIISLFSGIGLIIFGFSPFF